MKTKKTFKPLELAVFVLALSFPMLAQEGKGIGRIGGIVINPQGQAIEDAKVTLVFSKNEKVKLETSTNKKGEFSFLGLGTGQWRLNVAAKGYVPEEKAIDVSQLSVNPKITINLQKRGLGEGTGVIEDEASFAFLENGNRLLNEQKYDEALVAYQQFLEKNPLAYHVNISIGDCYRGKGEYDKAIEVYNQVIEQAKADPTLGKEMTAKALAGIGQCYLKQDKIEEAQKLFEQSIENSPDDEILAYNVGEICFSNQKYDQALTYFQLAAKIKPDWPDSYLKLGYVFLNKGDTASAIPMFEKFLALEPDTERSALVKNILTAIKK